ncbi:hypothetical protein AtNW77_Chr1g0051731 [Arabidopsis thaliana]
MIKFLCWVSSIHLSFIPLTVSFNFFITAVVPLLRFYQNKEKQTFFKQTFSMSIFSLEVFSCSKKLKTLELCDFETTRSKKITCICFVFFSLSFVQMHEPMSLTFNSRVLICSRISHFYGQLLYLKIILFPGRFILSTSINQILYYT